MIIDPRGSRGQPAILSGVDAIAEYLELTYPARPIFPEGARAVQSLFVHYVHEVLAKPLLPIQIPAASLARESSPSMPMSQKEERSAAALILNQFVVPDHVG